MPSVSSQISRLCQLAVGPASLRFGCQLALVAFLIARPLPAQIGSQPDVSGSLGVNIHFVDPAPGELAMLAASGVRWVRMDFNWQATETTVGQYDFSAYERLLAALDAYRLRAMFILDYHNRLYDSGLSPASDQARQAFATWAVAAVTHFRRRGILWEMYNEPNWFWTPRPDTQAYVKLALATGEAVHEAAPDEQLVGPASAVIDPPFLEACFSAGLLNYWSAVSIHPYRRKDPESAADDLREVRLLIQKYTPAGKNLPILAGEWGYSALWPAMSDDKQGAMLAREWLIALANDVPLAIWYDWSDGASAHDPEAHFGMVSPPEASQPPGPPTGLAAPKLSGNAGEAEPSARSSKGAASPAPFRPKPAYLAAQTLTHFLDGFRFNKRLTLESPDDYLLLSTNGDEVRLAAWTTGRSHTAVLPASPGQFDLTSFTGEKLPSLTAERRGLSVTLTRSPRYLVPAQANPLLSFAAAWQRLPLEIVVRAPGVLPLHLAAKNPSADAVRLSARVPDQSWEWEGASAEKVSPGAKGTVLLRVEAALRSVKPRPLRVELEAGKIGTVAQTTWIVASNPLRLTLLPATASELPVAIANPSGDPVQGRVEAEVTRGLDLKTFGTPLDMKAGVKGATVAFPLERRPDGEYSLGISIVDANGRPLCTLEPRRFSPILDFPRYMPGSASTGYSLAVDGAAVSDENKIAVGLPAGGPPSPGMDAAQLGFHLSAEHSGVRLVPPPALAAVRVEAMGEPTALGLWLYGDGSGVLPFVRFTDSTGQTFQDGGGPINWKGWRYVLIYLAGPGGSHSAGANDGVIHYPIHWDSLLMLQNPPGRAVEGTIYLTGLTLIYGPGE